MGPGRGRPAPPGGTLYVVEFHPVLASLGLVPRTELAPWPRWPRMEPTERGWWRLPDAEPRVPLLFALRATSPALL